MSSATATPLTAPAPTPPESSHGPRGTRAVLALARFEARELFHQIPILLVFALYALQIAVRLVQFDGMSDYPVLNTVDRRTQTTPLLVAIALLICVNAAALRSRKSGTVQQLGVLPMDPWRRTAAHLLSVLPFAALTAVFVGGEYAWEALKPGAIGHGSVGELAVGPLLVLLAGITGVLLARLLPSSFVPIGFTIVAYMGVVLASSAGGEGSWAGWLSPLVYSGDSGGDPVPAYLLGRPADWHALYVTGLCALLACAALLLTGGRTRAVAASTALALAATAAGVIGQLPLDKSELDAVRRTATKTPQKVQTCTTYGGSRYCSFPEWESVRSDWAEVVDRLQSAAGGPAAKAHLTIRQRVDVIDDVEADNALWPSATPGQVTVGTRWGGNRVPEFAVGAASVLVAGTESVTLDDMCDARPVTIMWLVLGTDPDPLDTFQKVRLDDSVTGSAYVLAPTNGLYMTNTQTTVVRELLERPRAEVTARVRSHWTELTSAHTSTAEAARLLGVEVPKEAEQCEE